MYTVQPSGSGACLKIWRSQVLAWLNLILVITGLTSRLQLEEANCFGPDQLGFLTVAVVIVVLSFRSLCLIGLEKPLWGVVKYVCMYTWYCAL